MEQGEPILKQYLMVVLHGKLKLWLRNPCDQNRICLRQSRSEIMRTLGTAEPGSRVIVSASLSGEIRRPRILPTPDRDRLTPAEIQMSFAADFHIGLAGSL